MTRHAQAFRPRFRCLTARELVGIASSNDPNASPADVVFLTASGFGGAGRKLGSAKARVRKLLNARGRGRWVVAAARLGRSSAINVRLKNGRYDDDLSEISTLVESVNQALARDVGGRTDA